MLFKLSKEKKHSHIAYIIEKEVTDPITGEVVTSVSGVTTNNNGHVHNIVDRNGTLTMLEAGKVPHTHEIQEELVYKIDDSQIIKDNDLEEKTILLKNIKDLVESEEESITDAKKCVEYYNGKQWNESDKSALEKQGRPALTINELTSKVDFLEGFSKQNRTDIRFYAMEESDGEVSQVLTEAIKNIFSTNNFNNVENSVLNDQIVAGRGIFHAYVDYNKNLFGKIVVEKLAFNDVAIAPHVNTDLSDCEYIVKKKRIAKKQLLLDFPEKKDEILNYFQEKSEKTKHYQPIDAYAYTNDENKSTVDVNKQTVELKEVWQKIYDTIYSVVDYDNGKILTTNEISKSDIKLVEDLGLKVVKRVITNMQVTLLIDQIILDSRIEDQDYFPIVPVYCKKDGNKFVSKLKDLLDLQDLTNKFASQSVDIINKSSSYGWLYDAQTFDSPKEEMEFKRNSTRPGYTAKVRDLNRLPVQTQGVKFPSEIVNLMQITSDKMNLISGLSNDLMGGNSEREISSVAIVEKRRNTMILNEYIYDNMNQSKKLLAKVLLKMIQTTYSADRLFRLVGNKEMQEEQKQSLYATCENIINNLDIETYDVAVDISKESATTRSANFSLLLEMLKFGAPIPPSVIISSSDLPNKDEILGIISAQAQASAEAEDKKYQTELDKVKLAHGISLDGQGSGLPQQMNPNPVPSQGQTPQQM